MSLGWEKAGGNQTMKIILFSLLLTLFGCGDHCELLSCHEITVCRLVCNDLDLTCKRVCKPETVCECAD